MNELVFNVAARQRKEFELLCRQSHLTRGKVGELVRSLSSPLVKVITGPRRAGKSTLAVLALKGRKVAYLNFEDEGLPEKVDGDEIVEVLESVYPDAEFFLFDEIQNLDRWEQLLNRLHRLGKNIVVTGSNANLLGTELATSLTGRHLAIELLPLAFSELPPAVDNSACAFERYLRSGGFPDVALGKNEAASFLPTLWDSVVFKDIAKRHKIRNLQELRSLFSLYLHSVSSRFSGQSLARSLNGSISVPTVQKFLSYGREAYLIAELLPYSPKPKLRMKSDRKAYVIDNGFVSSMTSSSGEDVGRMLENLVMVELWRRGFKPGQDLFYYVTRSNYEVDFLVRDGHRNLELIQVCLNLSSQKTLERELRALCAAGDELGVDKLTVITLDEERMISQEGKSVAVVSAPRWCLMKEIP